MFLYIVILLIAAYWDWKNQKIDNRISAFIVLLAIADVCSASQITILERACGVCAVALPMLLVTMMIPGAFGGGDIKLMAASGMLLGATRVSYAMLFAIFAAGIYAGIRLLSGRCGRKERFAFGPFLALGLSMVVYL